VTKLDIFVDEVIFLFDFLEIGMNLRGKRVIMTPQFNLPRKLIINGRNITCAT
jgi:hypothetical protein